MSLAPRIALVGALLAAPSSSQASLVRSEGVLGGTVVYELSGDPSEIYVLMPSLSAGPTPLSIIDPGDPRSMDVAWDLVSLWIGGFLGAGGTTTLTLGVPPNPGLQGVAIHAQFLTWPGTTTTVDELSNATAFRLSTEGASTFTVNEHVEEIDGHTVTTLDDGRVLIAGGGTPAGTALAGFHLFDPQSGSFSATTGAMQQGRTAHTATKLADGRVLFLGGADETGTVTASGDVWDPVTGLATPVAPMSSPRTQHTATRLADGRVFVAGGVSQFDLADPIAALGSALSSTQVYDPVTNSWQNGPSLGTPRLAHAATLLPSGKVLIAGGIEVPSIFGVPIPDFSNDCRRYVPGSNSLQSTASFSGARATHGLVTLPDGRALLGGGADGNFLALTFNALSSCRTYDETANAWTNVGSFVQARAYLNLLVAGSSVVAVGGLASVDVATGTGSPASIIETSDVGAIAWSSPSSLLYERVLATSAVIEDGRRVLTTGTGDNGSGGATPDLTAEVFLP